MLLRSRLFLIVLLVFMLGLVASPSRASKAPYPQSIKEEIDALLAAGADQSSDPVFLVKLADLYLDAGDLVYTNETKRIQAYEEGARFAKRALEIQEPNAQAHYLYAANIGSAGEVKGLAAAALSVRTMNKHLDRALDLKPDYPAALHMKGMLLDGLPGLLGGDSAKALSYVQRAVTIAPNYTHARLNLAQMYIERENIPAAQKELRAVIQTKHPQNPYTWARFHKPEAEKLLRSIEEES